MPCSAAPTSDRACHDCSVTGMSPTSRGPPLPVCRSYSSSKRWQMSSDLHRHAHHLTRARSPVFRLTTSTSVTGPGSSCRSQSAANVGPCNAKTAAGCMACMIAGQHAAVRMFQSSARVSKHLRSATPVLRQGGSGTAGFSYSRGTQLYPWQCMHVQPGRQQEQVQLQAMHSHVSAQLKVTSTPEGVGVASRCVAHTVARPRRMQSPSGSTSPAKFYRHLVVGTLAGTADTPQGTCGFIHGGVARYSGTHDLTAAELR